MRSSFRHAFAGLRYIFVAHTNIRIHIFAGILVLSLAFALHVSRIEVLILIFSITLVMITELLNTALEEITNLITVKWAKQAKIAKDVAAGMVLVSAFSAFVVGGCIFIPYIVALVR